MTLKEEQKEERDQRTGSGQPFHSRLRLSSIISTSSLLQAKVGKGRAANILIAHPLSLAAAFFFCDLGSHAIVPAYSLRVRAKQVGSDVRPMVVKNMVEATVLPSGTGKVGSKLAALCKVPIG